MEPRPAGRTTFSEDPTYLAALEAAARGSVLSATSGLASLSLQPGQQQQQQRRGLAGSAQGSEPGAPPLPPPKDAPTPPPAKGAGAASTKADRRKAAANESGASQAAGPAAAALGRAVHAPAPASTAAAAAAAAASAAAEAAAGPSRSGKGAAAASGQKGSSAGAKGAGRDAAREAMPARYAEYLSQEDLQRGFKEGQLFRGKLRVNPGDRREGYVTVPGLPHDMAVRGDAAQNRAVEGDEVALSPLPPAQWLALGRGRERDRGREAGEAKGQREEELEAEMARAPANDTPWTSIKSPDGVKEWMRTFAGSRPELRITAKVVAILSPSPKREHVVGLLQLGAAPSAPSASAYQSAPAPTCYLVPLDPRLPRCVVRPAELKNLPEALWEELRAGQEGGEGGEAGSRTLMSARIAEWSSSHVCPAVTLRASLGQAGEIESETAAILEMEDIRGREGGGWEPEVLACLPPLPWSIAPEELAKRRDFRSVRVFSIDPPTAKDLDDALSIQPLDLGPGRGSGWRVGVHIADVAHFIPPFSALDVEAGRRATSVYLVQRVIPMLPPLLCEELCSLNPGVERLAFSVVWDMDAEGNILDTWFGRTVIRSCAKLSYPMVQAMIEGRFNPSDWHVSIQGEGISWEEVMGDSLTLWSIASRLRAGRYAGGALRLDGTKMCYTLDRDGNPVAAAPYVQQEANQLVEEFMLLANMSVAECISSTFRDKALLRRHPPPNQNKLKVLQEVAAAAGMAIDTASAATIQAGLAALRAAAADAAAAEAAAGQDATGLVAAAAANDDGEALATLLAAAEGDAAEGNGNGNGNGNGGGGRHGVGRMRRMVELLTMLATRPMQLAEYFCTGLMDDEHMWRHYALAIPAYTHFTSPIRRYPDLVVHRLLAAALEVRAGQRGAEEAAKAHRLLDTRLTGMVAEHCNEKRLTARNAQDGSLRLYLCVLLRRHPCLTTGVVSNLGGDRYCGVFLPEFGHEIRLEVDELGVPVDSSWNAGAKVMTLRHSEGEGQGGQQQQQMGRRKQGNGSGNGRGQGGKGSGGRGFGGRGGQRGGGGGSGGGGSGGVLGMAAGDLAEWVEGLPAVRNPHGLRPVQLPLHLQLFSEVPVLLTSKMVAGQPSELYGRLYLREAEEAVAAGQARAAAAAAAAAGAQGGGEAAAAAAVAEQVAAAVAAAEGPGVRESEISWESTLND